MTATAFNSGTVTEVLERVEVAPTLDIVVPVHNEQDDLEASINRLRQHLTKNLPYSFRITIADNASTDGTAAIAQRLAINCSDVRVVHLDQKGRGRALREAWSRSDAEVLAYMDVDLSTDLAALLPLIAPLLSGHSDLAIGSRLAKGARVVRGAKREMISRCYNLILRRAMAANFTDAQCGFKAIRRDVAIELLPLIEDTGWFFDTEMLLLAQHSGLRVHEVPVDWVDDPDSRVDIVATALADLRGVMRVGRGLLTGSISTRRIRERFARTDLSTRDDDNNDGFVQQLTRFVVIGAGSTAAYLLLFILFRSWTNAQVANIVALLTTAIGNTAANRRLTFGIRGAHDIVRQHLQGLLVVGFGLALTAASLVVLHGSDADPARWVELLVLVLANLVTTFVRFLALRLWIFSSRRAAPEGLPRS